MLETTIMRATVLVLIAGSSSLFDPASFQIVCIALPLWGWGGGVGGQRGWDKGKSLPILSPLESLRNADYKLKQYPFLNTILLICKVFRTLINVKK